MNWKISSKSQILIMSAIGVSHTLMEFYPSSHNILEEVWRMELAGTFSPYESFIKSVIAAIILAKGLTGHLYIALYFLILYPVIMEKMKSVLLIWLYLAGLRSILLNIGITIIGVGLCSLLPEINLSCVKFSTEQACELGCSIYMWTVVNDYYHTLKKRSSVRSHLQSPLLSSNSSQLTDDTSSLLISDEWSLPASLVEELHKSTGNNLNELSDKKSESQNVTRSVDSLLAQAMVDWFIKKIFKIRSKNDNVSPLTTSNVTYLLNRIKKSIADIDQESIKDFIIPETDKSNNILEHQLKGIKESEVAANKKSDGSVKQESDGAVKQESDGAVKQESDGAVKQESDGAVKQESDGAVKQESDGIVKQESDVAAKLMDSNYLEKRFECEKDGVSGRMSILKKIPELNIEERFKTIKCNMDKNTDASNDERSSKTAQLLRNIPGGVTLRCKETTELKSNNYFQNPFKDIEVNFVVSNPKNRDPFSKAINKDNIDYAPNNALEFVNRLFPEDIVDKIKENYKFKPKESQIIFKKSTHMCVADKDDSSSGLSKSKVSFSEIKILSAKGVDFDEIKKLAKDENDEKSDLSSQEKALDCSIVIVKSLLENILDQANRKISSDSFPSAANSDDSSDCKTNGHFGFKCNSKRVRCVLKSVNEDRLSRVNDKHWKMRKPYNKENETRNRDEKDNVKALRYHYRRISQNKIPIRKSKENLLSNKAFKSILDEIKFKENKKSIFQNYFINNRTDQNNKDIKQLNLEKSSQTITTKQLLNKINKIVQKE